MIRFASRPIALTLVAIGGLIGGAQAFPAPGPGSGPVKTIPFPPSALGVIEPGDCILIHREIVDSSQRVRLRVEKRCY